MIQKSKQCEQGNAAQEFKIFTKIQALLVSQLIIIMRPRLQKKLKACDNLLSNLSKYRVLKFSMYML